jgi:hypothetical protein
MTGLRTTPGGKPVHRHDGPEPPAPRQQIAYRCARGHSFMVTLAAGIEPPEAWDCRCGAQAGQAGEAADDERGRRMVQLLSRRTRAELEQILADRLAEVTAARKTGQPAPATGYPPRSLRPGRPGGPGRDHATGRLYASGRVPHMPARLR